MIGINFNPKEIIPKLPKEVQDVLNSDILHQNIEDLGLKYSLHYDQIGDLDMTTRRMLMGVEKKEEFVKNIEERLEIDNQMSQSIAKDINDVVINKIKEELRRRTEEENENGMEDVNTVSVNEQKTDATPQISREEILSSIENPEKISRIEAMPINLIKSPSPQVPQIPSSPTIPENKPKIDPYREPV